MEGVLATITVFPTVVFTVLLGIALLYWGLVIAGALDMDFLGGDAADVDGIIDIGDGGSFDLFSALRLSHAPLTVVLSVFSLAGWLISALGMQTLGPIWPSALPDWALSALVFLASFVLATITTSFVARPFGKLFQTHGAKGRADLTGKVCVISTGRVNERYGQATLEDGGSGLILQVRAPEGQLARGQRALIIGWDEKAQGFEVEPLDDLLLADGQDEAKAIMDNDPSLSEAERELAAVEEAEAEAKQKSRAVT